MPSHACKHIRNAVAFAEPSANKPDVPVGDSAHLNEATRLLFAVYTRDEDATVCIELSAVLLTDGLRLCRLPQEGVADTVEQLAAEHLESIRSVQPSGPYRLVGSGLGGLVAHEIAFRLLGED